MSRIILTFFVGLALALNTAMTAFAAFDKDLAINAEKFVVLPETLTLAGELVQIYVTVDNQSQSDLTGIVKFYVDGNQIGNDQSISTRFDSLPDEVFVTWEAVAGEHLLVAEIFPDEAENDDPANNYVEQSFFVDTDNDGDGVGDSVDNDDDNDGLTDATEQNLGTNAYLSDTDGDSVIDSQDDFPLDSSEWLDSDQDSIGNNADLDDDNDSLLDTTEEQIGTDPLNPDTDGDGLENCNDAADDFPLDAAECVDTDGDGVGDNADVFPEDPLEDTDCDEDGLGNNADLDDDNDGTPDEEDELPCNPLEIYDCDADGLGDREDPDDDNDGYADEEDAFVCDPTEWLDSDQDGLGDNSDPNDENLGPEPVIGGDRLVTLGEEVIFDGSESRDLDGEIRQFSWDFGDGSPLGQQAIETHTFEEVGEFVVRLTVTDDAEESRTEQAIVVVENSDWLQQALFWLLWILLLLLIYIFWRTLKNKKGQKIKQ